MHDDEAQEASYGQDQPKMADGPRFAARVNLIGDVGFDPHVDGTDPEDHGGAGDMQLDLVDFLEVGNKGDTQGRGQT